MPSMLVERSTPCTCTPYLTQTNSTVFYVQPEENRMINDKRFNQTSEFLNFLEFILLTEKDVLSILKNVKNTQMAKYSRRFSIWKEFTLYIINYARIYKKESTYVLQFRIVHLPYEHCAVSEAFIQQFWVRHSVDSSHLMRQFHEIFGTWIIVCNNCWKKSSQRDPLNYKRKALCVCVTYPPKALRCI